MFLEGITLMKHLKWRADLTSSCVTVTAELHFTNSFPMLPIHLYYRYVHSFLLYICFLTKEVMFYFQQIVLHINT